MRRGTILLPFDLVETDRMHRLAFPRGATWLLVISILVVAVFNGMAARAGAALSKPTYAAGDRWVYVLDGSLNAFPNLNASQTGAFHFDLVGRVEVNVLGPSSVLFASLPISVVAVEMNTKGFLNGTFAVPSVGTAQVTGTFTTRTSEIWEDRAYLPIRSNTATSYLADVTLGFGFSTSLTATVRVNASASVATIPPFELEVGASDAPGREFHVHSCRPYAELGESDRCLLRLASRGLVSGERHGRGGNLHRVQAESDGREFPGHRRHCRRNQRDRLLLE